MALVGLRLSPDDQTLLEATLAIEDPAELGEMVKTIPPGAEVEEVVTCYHVEARDGERERWVRCCACAVDHKHKRGFVVKIKGGDLATVGLTCGKTKHHLEYKEQFEAFERRLVRRRVLERLLAAYRRHADLVAALDAMQRDAGLRGLAELRHDLERRFPDFVRKLRHYPDGRLMAKYKVRDYEAERARDDRLDRKLEQLSRRRGVSRDERGADQRLLAELAAERDPDASKEQLTKLERREAARYAGASYVTRFADLPGRLIKLRHRALHTLDEVDGKETAALTTKNLERVLNRVVSVVDDALSYQQEVADAVRFLDVANLSTIVRYVNRQPDVIRQGLQFALVGRRLRVEGRDVLLDLAFVPPALESGPLESVRRDVAGERKRMPGAS